MDCLTDYAVKFQRSDTDVPVLIGLWLHWDFSSTSLGHL